LISSIPLCRPPFHASLQPLSRLSSAPFSQPWSQIPCQGKRTMTNSSHLYQSTDLLNPAILAGRPAILRTHFHALLFGRHTHPGMEISVYSSSSRISGKASLVHTSSSILWLADNSLSSLAAIFRSSSSAWSPIRSTCSYKATASS